MTSKGSPLSKEESIKELSIESVIDLTMGDSGPMEIMSSVFIESSSPAAGTSPSGTVWAIPEDPSLSVETV